MKRIFQIGVLAIALTLGMAPAMAVPQVYKLRVDGLSCPFCAYGIEKKLGALKGVQRIEVDIASGANSSGASNSGGDHPRVGEQSAPHPGRRAHRQPGFQEW